MKGEHNMNSNKSRGRKRKLFASALLILRILFGGMQSSSASSNSTNFQNGVNSKTEISRVLEKESFRHQEGSAQPEQVMKGSQTTLKIPHGGDGNSSQPSKFTAGSKAKGAARKATANRARNSKAGNSQSGISPFAQAFTVEPKFPARPGQNRDGLFGRFSARPTPDPSNPGCAGGPRSITVLSGQSNANSPTNQPVREITAHDGVKGKLTDKSLNHLTSKHADALGIDDPLPPNPNQKPTAYKQIRTRINEVNKRKFGDTVEKILEDPNTEVFPDISMRGITGRGYYNEDYGESGFFVGIHNEGDFTGQIKKAQPISEAQLKVLQEKNKID